jgi:hypothetical protein
MIYPYRNSLRFALPAALMLFAAACTTPRPAPETLQDAQRSIDAAVEAGAEEYSPVELRFAREKLTQARDGMDRKSYDNVIYLVEQSEINSELALQKTRTAVIRARVTELQRENEILREDFQTTFGEDFQ